MSASPSDDELRNALIALRAENPNLGIPKLHSLLLSKYPSWTVSEKRTRKILQNEGLVLAPPASAKKQKEPQADPGREQAPSSKLIKDLDVSKWTTKVAVKYFSRQKGKGLVATVKISEGETIWKEDPFLLAPEWEIHDLQTRSLACGHCSTPLRDSPITIACPANKGASHPSCPARFCNRLCLMRSAHTHTLLCPTLNPASVPLMTFARRKSWMALHALMNCTARLLLTYQQDKVEFGVDWDFVQSLACLSMEERAKGGWMTDEEANREEWRRSYQLYLQAFKEPPSEAEKKKLARLLKRPLPDELATALFSYEGFLLNLGRMSLNIEAHGGIYVLHSHMNHDCSPNVSARHFDRRTALSRITILAKKDIEPGEELFITYVNPDLPVKTRRQQLMEWGFGTCQCLRCIAEGSDTAADTVPSGPGADDLESELKAGLGVW